MPRPLLPPAACWLAALLIVAGCTGAKKDDLAASPRGYNLKKPQRLKLPLELDEISGLAYFPQDSSLLAINDERGYLYKIFPSAPETIQRWAFATGADYEDVVILGEDFYVLQSSGALTRFRFVGGSDSLERAEYAYARPDGGVDEFETLFWDAGMHRLVLVCKDCDADKKHYLSTVLFNIDSARYETSPFTIDAQSIAGLLGEKSIRFKPSAGAIHPLTGELYLISAVNKLLVVTSRDGRKVEAAYKLDGGTFKQPEGLAFSPSGTLYISNEAADIGVADVLIFPFSRTELP